MSNKRAILTVAALLVIINLTLGIRWYLSSRSEHPAHSCVDNLRLLANAKLRWSLAQNKSANDVPTWDDLQTTLKQKPACPGGGTYTLERVGAAPICSLGGPDHTLPAPIK